MNEELSVLREPPGESKIEVFFLSMPVAMEKLATELSRLGSLLGRSRLASHAFRPLCCQAQTQV